MSAVLRDALTACLLVGALAIAMSAPDPTIPDPENVVMLDFHGNIPDQENAWMSAAPIAFGDMLKARHVPLDLISRVAFSGMAFRAKEMAYPGLLLVIDPDMVPLLGLRPLCGDLQETLARKDGLAPNLALVHQLWGDIEPQQALGRTVRGESDEVYTVTAVIPNSDPRSPLGGVGNWMVGYAAAMVGFDSIAQRPPQEERDALYLMTGRVFAKLRPDTDLDAIGRWMHDAFVANPHYQDLPAEWRTNREAAFFRALRLTQLPFEEDPLRWTLLGAVAAAAGLLLVLAAFNVMNLTTANLLARQRETALRRSLGADGWALLRLWSVEAFLPLLAAAVLALWLSSWLAPAVADWLAQPSKLAVTRDPPPVLLLWLGVTVTLLLPLILALPAARALRAAPATALQGRTRSEGPLGRRVRQGLLGLQFGGAILLLALAGVLAAQQQHMIHLDRGFETANRYWFGIQANPEKLPDIRGFLGALNRDPAVIGWAYSDMRPAADTRGQTELHVAESGQRSVLRITTVSPHFFEVWGMTVLAGSPTLGSGETHMVIDTKAARLLGFATPQAAIGAQLRGGGEFLQEGDAVRRVVAVIGDLKMESARDAAMPQGFLLTDVPQWDLTIRGDDAQALQKAIEADWEAQGAQVPYVLQSADAQIAENYRDDARFGALLTTIALLAVGVAMLGAHALIADTLQRRRMDLVLRRLHGAGDGAIVRQVARDFVGPLLISALVALPLAMWAASVYLARFVDRVGLTTGLILPVCAAVLLMIAVTALAAARHLWLALRLQPIEALR